MASPYFTQDAFDFLATLAANNRREWFMQHKPDYEAATRTPALNFIRDATADHADALAHVPRGYAKDHPRPLYLKRKDFIGVAPRSDAGIRAKNFYPVVVERFAQGAPFMRF